MSHAQSGILLKNSHAVFLEADITQKDAQTLKSIASVCQVFVEKLQALQAQYDKANLGAVVAFGHVLWQELKQANHADSGSELVPFTQKGTHVADSKANHVAPATQHNLLIHIQSQRHDVNFSVAQLAVALFGDFFEIKEEIHGFRWVEDRDLSGFVDGTENPAGNDRATVALIPADQPDANGSYVLTQRYEHDLNKWQTLDTEQQEKVIGRTKADDQELPSSERPDTSHVSRVDLKEDGKGLKILRQSLPYGTASGVHGLYFMAYCHTLHNIDAQLNSMFGETDGKTDLMMTHLSKAVTGSYYFAPSLTQLVSL